VGLQRGAQGLGLGLAQRCRRWRGRRLGPGLCGRQAAGGGRRSRPTDSARSTVSAVMWSPSVSSTARSSTLRSSRTLPGKG
jgi:hypothetical protein